MATVGVNDRALTVARLTATPTLLGEMARDAGTHAWTPPKPGEWSIGEVVRHLVEGDRDTFVPRLRRMLAEPRPVFDKTRRTEGDNADLATLLAAFAAARKQALTLLGGLDEAGWRREGVSPSRGAVSVEAYARTMDAHDTEHLRQIQDVRATLGLTPKRCEARVAVPLGELLKPLAATPDLVAALAAGLDAETLSRRPEPEEWSMKEVLAHLMELDSRLFLPRFRLMATEDRPGFTAFDPVAWARERDRREGRFEDDLAAFRRARAEAVAYLATLPPGAGDRPGLSGFFGPLSLAQYVTHMADHDLEHLAQMRACRAIVAAPAELPASARRVADALAAAGVTTTIVVLEQAARTSADAARAVGCDVGQIVKSLVFRLRDSGRPLLVLTSGANRVDEAKLGALLGEPLGKADAEFVRTHTGFAIGGVAPLAHPAPLTTLVDEDLLKWDAIWAAGGHPHTVFRLTGDELRRVTGGRVIRVN